VLSQYNTFSALRQPQLTTPLLAAFHNPSLNWQLASKQPGFLPRLGCNEAKWNPFYQLAKE
jgi:hypothetical protein